MAVKRRAHPVQQPSAKASEPVVSPLIGRAFLLFALILLPWTAWIVIHLPDRARANHWALAWGGLDVALALCLAATAVTILRRSPWTAITATATGTLLVCDAWFDVLTSSGTTTVTIAVLEALLAELPLAILCFWIARNVERVVDEARQYLVALGVRVKDRHLVTPEAFAARAERGPDPSAEEIEDLVG